jgi:hypothetical protein
MTALGETGVVGPPYSPYAKANFSNGVITGWSVQFFGPGNVEMGTTYNSPIFKGAPPTMDYIYTPGSQPCAELGALSCTIANDSGTWVIAGQGKGPPQASNEITSTNSDTSVQINLATGATGAPTSAALIASPTNGVVTGFPGTTVLYTPNAGYAGSDGFQFTLSNGGGTSNTASAAISVVANPPVSVNETAASLDKAPVSINLLAGSTGSVTSAALVGSPTGGTVTGFPSTTVTFTPAGNPSGPWGFQFTLANSSGTSNTSTVTVWPTLIPLALKSVCSAVSGPSDAVANTLDAAAVVLDGGSTKQIAENIAINAFINGAITLISRNDEVFGGKIDLSVGTVMLLRKALSKFAKVNPTSLELEVYSLVFTGVTLGANVCAEDPPDLNYTVVALPQKLPVLKSGNNTVDQLESDYLKYFSLNVATVHAAERWQGATLAGATKYEALQKKAYKKYSKEAAKALSVLNADDTTLSKELPAVDISAFPGGAAGLSAVFNAQCGQPLPKDLNSALLSLQVSQQEIDQVVCNYVETVTPANISTNFEAALAVQLP